MKDFTAATTASLSLVGGLPTRLAIERDVPVGGEAGVPLSPPPILRMLDSVGNSAADAGVVVRAALSGGAGTLTNGSASTDSLGRATFTGLTIVGGTGIRALQFSSDGLTGVGSRSVTVAPATRAFAPLSRRWKSWP